MTRSPIRPRASRPARRAPRTTGTRAGVVLCLLGVVGASPLLAQPAPSDLTVEAIFGSGELWPRGLPALQWTPGGERFTWVQPGRRGGTDLLAMDPVSGDVAVLVDGSTLVPPGASAPIAIEGYQWGPLRERLLIYTNSQRVWRRNTKGTYFILDLASRELAPVSERAGWQQFAKFSPDGTMVGFVRDHDLFVVDLASGEESRLTSDGSETIINGTFDWVYEEELGLRDGWRWSPDSRRIAYWRLDQSPVREFAMLDPLSLYPEVTRIRYPKAGEANSLAWIKVVEVESGHTISVDTGEEADVYLARMEWADSPDELVIQRLNRHQNRLDVLLADARTGESRVILSETSDTWVDVDLDLTWVRDGRQFLWTSERSGYEHIYLYNRDGSLARQLTSGAWDAERPHGVSADGWVYFTAPKESPLERHLYRVGLDGGKVEKLTERPGWHDARMSPDMHFYVDDYSRFGVPPSYGVFRGDGTPVRTLEENADLRARLGDLDLGDADFFTFTTSDGVTLNGWMIKPPDFDASLEYPVLMSVYGGPGSQEVTDRWGGPHYLWHQMLAEDGYIVVSVDGRGTGGRGRAFKNVTYLDLGNWETHDQIEAARWLGALDYVDEDRIGIWGWSYGGYLTLMSLFEGGDAFAAGISVAPVTHWKFYDTIYTERYMRTPRENPEGYRDSAPLTHVEGLEGALLLVHGGGDDNVHLQNTLSLALALQQAGKPFDLMVYPGSTHAIAGAASQTHLFNTMTAFVKEHLPVIGAVAAHAGG